MKKYLRRILAMLCVTIMLISGVLEMSSYPVAYATDTTDNINNTNNVVDRNREWLIYGDNTETDLTAVDVRTGNRQTAVVKNDFSVCLPAKGISEANLALYVKINVVADETSLLNLSNKDTYIELCNGNQPDNYEIHWKFTASKSSALVNGSEQEILLPFAEAGHTNGTDGIDTNIFSFEDAITYFRFYTTAFSGEEYKDVASIPEDISCKITISEIRIVYTKAGLEFGMDDSKTYLQLSSPLTDIPKTIEASIKKDAVQNNSCNSWTVAEAGMGLLNNSEIGVTSTNPEGGILYEYQTIGAGNAQLNVKRQFEVQDFGEYAFDTTNGTAEAVKNSEISLAFWMYFGQETTLNSDVTKSFIGLSDLEYRDLSNGALIYYSMAGKTYSEGWHYVEIPLNEMEVMEVNPNNANAKLDVTQLQYVRFQSNDVTGVFGMTDIQLLVSGTDYIWNLTNIDEEDSDSEILNSGVSTVYSATTKAVPDAGCTYEKVSLAEQALVISNTYEIDIPSLYVTSVDDLQSNQLAVSFWLYSSVDTALGDGQLELNSSGQRNDSSEIRYQFKRALNYPITSGWNYVELPLSSFTYDVSGGTVDLAGLNYVRLYTAALTGEFAITDIQLSVLETEIIRASYTSNHGEMIFSNTDSGDENQTALLVTNEGYPAYVEGKIQYTLRKTVCTGAWVDIAVVRDAESITFFVDGSKMATVEAVESAITVPVSKHSIGADGIGNQIFVGTIADIRLWNRACTEEEIQTNHVDKEQPGVTAFAPSDTSGLVGSWFLVGDSSYVEDIMPDTVGHNDAIFCGNKKEYLVTAVYENVTGGIAPDTLEDGYIFGGWYKEPSCVNVVEKDENVRKAYAKLVLADVLDVKAQVSATLQDESTANDSTGAIRFITTVDSLEYKEIGFEFLINGVLRTSRNTDVVYEKLYAVGTTDEVLEEYLPNIEFSPQSKYFKSWTFKNIPDTDFYTPIIVKPYWVTLDGTKVYGITRIKQVTMGHTDKGNANPQIVNTAYETDDVVMADIIPTQMGYAVDSTGIEDSTAGINQALLDCANAGGGTVYLPVGTYRITGQIDIPGYVTLRGDWQDPDGEAWNGEYGTVILADISEVEDATLDTGTILLGGSGGVVGLTVYYPNQTSLSDVKKYPYTFFTDGLHDNMMLSTIQNVTVINGYRGIGTTTERNHEQLLVENFKGTFLDCGACIYRQSDSGFMDNVVISPKYWSSAPNSMSPPLETELQTYTKENAVGLILNDIDWGFYGKIAIEYCKTGISMSEGIRSDNDFSGNMYELNIENCVTGLDVSSLNRRCGVLISKSVIAEGITATHQAQTTTVTKWGRIKLCDVDVKGTQSQVVKDSILTDTESDLSNYRLNYDAGYSRPKDNFVIADLPKGNTEDVSKELQIYLDVMSAAGGGVVYVPGGEYCLTNPVSVPAEVELRGSSSVATREQMNECNGTLIYSYYGDGSDYDAETDTALITLNGNNAGLNGIRIMYPKNGPKDDNINTTYTVRGNGSGVYVVNCMISASGYGVDFRNCDNHYIRSLMSCCYYNAILAGGQDGMIRGCWNNGTVLHRTVASVLGFVYSGDEAGTFATEDTWPDNTSEKGDLSSILSENCNYIILQDAVNQQIYESGCYALQNCIINKNSTNTLAVNVNADNIGKNGYMFVMDSGTMDVINAMRYEGSAYQVNAGTLSLYNRLTYDKQLEKTETVIK